MSENQQSTINNQKLASGSVYLYVLASSLLITILGLGSLAAVRVQMRAARLARDSAAARACAVSAIELGLLRIRQDPAWRTTLPNGTWLDNQALGDGRLTLEGTDPQDGSLSDSPSDPLILTGVGVRGTARHKAQVTLVPVIKPLAALQTCLSASGLVRTNAGKRLTVFGACVSANGQLDNDGTIDGSAEAQSVDHTGTVTGTLTVPGTVRPVPDTDLFADYVRRATPVSAAGTMENFVLTPGCSPFGPTDPNGLYVINTNGANLTLRNGRICGTLIILAAGGTVTLEQALFLQNGRSDFPTLLIEGDVIIKLDSAARPLSEAACATNFNPVGAPYQDIVDEDQVDEYPNEIRGLIHVKGSLRLQRTARLVGAVICEGSVLCEEANTILHDPALYASPPQGYTFIESMAISPGSWEQVVD